VLIYFLLIGSKIIMAALCNRAGHYIFDLSFLSIFYLLSSPNLSSRMVWP